MSISMAVGQEVPQRKLDSLEVVLYSLEKRDSTRIVKLGNYILQKTSSDHQRYKIYQKLSESYFLTNDIDKSFNSLFNAKEVAERIGNPMLLAQAYGSIANQYSYLNLTDKARLYLNQAIKQVEKLPDGKNKYRLKGLSYIELGKLDFNNGSFGNANLNYRKSLWEFNKIPQLDKDILYHYKRSLYNIGNSYYYLKNPDSAEIYLQRALSVDDSQGKTMKYYIYSTLSEVYSYRGNSRRAIDTLQSIINDPDFDIPSLKSEIYLNLSKNYKVLGDESRYVIYNEKYLALQEKQKGKDMKAISTAFDAEQKDFVSSISQSRIRTRWLVVSIIIIILLSVGTVLYLNKRRREERSIYESVIAGLKNDSSSLRDPDIVNFKEIESTHNIPYSVEEEILEKLKRFQKTEKFRNPKLTISTLATQLKTNPTYLSIVIKKHTDKNFNSYINELRIRHICEKIYRHPEYLNYKISYLAADCGFASHSVFSTVFKSVIGISPSVFLREAEKSHAVLYKEKKA